MSEPLTSDEYVQMSGMTCPVCQCMPRFLQRGPLERIADMVVQPMACAQCQATWTSVYDLARYAELTVPATEETAQRERTLRWT